MKRGKILGANVVGNPLDFVPGDLTSNIPGHRAHIKTQKIYKENVGIEGDAYLDKHGRYVLPSGRDDKLFDAPRDVHESATSTRYRTKGQERPPRCQRQRQDEPQVIHLRRVSTPRCTSNQNRNTSVRLARVQPKENSLRKNLRVSWSSQTRFSGRTCLSATIW